MRETTTFRASAAFTVAVNALLLGVALLAAMSGLRPGEVGIHPNDPHRVCHAQWCQPGALARSAQEQIDAQVAEQGAGFECTKHARSGQFPAFVLAHRDGTSVVQRLSVEQAYHAVQTKTTADDVWMDAFCYRRTS